MMRKSPLENLRDKITTDIETRVQTLRTGTPTDFTTYKDLCGQIRGLELALDHVQRLLLTMEDSDE